MACFYWFTKKNLILIAIWCVYWLCCMIHYKKKIIHSGIELHEYSSAVFHSVHSLVVFVTVLIWHFVHIRRRMHLWKPDISSRFPNLLIRRKDSNVDINSINYTKPQCITDKDSDRLIKTLDIWPISIFSWTSNTILIMRMCHHHC